MGLPAFGTTLVASATVLSPMRRNDPTYDTIQGQLWDYYARLEEFSAAVSWKGNALSRVRLIAAEYIPGESEPKPITEGPAADAVARLGIVDPHHVSSRSSFAHRTPWLVSASRCVLTWSYRFSRVSSPFTQGSTPTHDVRTHDGQTQNQRLRRGR